MDWEVWIQVTGDPLPRKLAITYKAFPGTPRYLATLQRWDTKGLFKDDVFAFTPPEGAVQLDMLAVQDPATETAE